MNALLFKTVFSKRLGKRVAVAEYASSQGKANGSTSAPGVTAPLRSNAFALGLLGIGLGLTLPVWSQNVSNTALPTGASLAAGSALVSSSGATMTIEQSSQRAAINWQSFNIGKDAAVNVQQPSSSSVLLNRIGGDSPSYIFGRLSANGQVVLVNPNGITFGKDGSASTAGLTATTLGISDADFMSGNMRFTSVGGNGSIVNKGKLTASPGGYIALLGASVSNEGQISAPQGTAALAAAHAIKMPLTPSGRIKLELTPGSIHAAVANSGSIVTQGGQVYLQASAAVQAMREVLHSGLIDTSGPQAGDVTLLADDGRIQVSGTILANSSSATSPGGRIVIGRDEQSGALARSTDVSGAKLESQRGFVETSGQWLKTDGVQIRAGEWLIDPNDIVIDNSNPTSGMGLVNAQTLDGTSYINTTDLQNALNSAAVTITTSTTASGGNGDITVNSTVTNNSGNLLTLRAVRDINLNALIDSPLASVQLDGGRDVNVASTGGFRVTAGGPRSVTLTATRDIRIAGSFGVMGGVFANAGQDLVFDAAVSSNNYVGFAASAERDIRVNAAISSLGGGGLNLRSGRDIHINANVTSNGALNLNAGNAWNSAAISGALLLGNSATLSYGGTLSLLSGRSESITGNSINRADFSDSSLVWASAVSAAAAPNVTIAGFNNITLSNANNSGNTILASTMGVTGQTLQIDASISAVNLNLNAGSFGSTGGLSTGIGSMLNGFATGVGPLMLAAGKTLSYSNSLNLRSGKLADNSRASLNTGNSGSVVWANTPGSGSVTLDGFDTVNLNGPIGTHHLAVTAKQIHVQQNINASGVVQLHAAAFDETGNNNNIAGNGYYLYNGAYFADTSGWTNLRGTIALAPGVSIKSSYFDLRSGNDVTTPSVRSDLLDAAQLQPYSASGGSSPEPVNGLRLYGFRDVMAPSGIATIESSGHYDIRARNIDMTSLPALTIAGLNAYSTTLYAGAFNDVGGSSSYNLTADSNHAGTVTLPSAFILRSSLIDIRSGINNNTRSSGFAPAWIGPYTAVAGYDGPFYTTSNGVTTYRIGGTPGWASSSSTGQASGRQMYVRGFANVVLPAGNPINFEQVDIAASNITVNADINAGQGSWNPWFYYLSLRAGHYNVTTGVASGTNAGRILFNNNPVLRVQANGGPGQYSLNGTFGFNNSLSIVNGSTPADFTGVRLGYTRPDYSSGGTGQMGYVSISGFDNTRIELENASDKLISYAGFTRAGSISITQRSGSTGSIEILNDLIAPTSTSTTGAITLDAGQGSIRMGSRVAQATNISVAAGRDSAVNTDADSLTMTSRTAGQTLVVNEANNINFNAGTSADAGSIELNARGEITLSSNLSRTNVNSSVTLRADARYGRTINPGNSAFTSSDLNDTFASYNNGTYGELGGDGLGALRVITAQPTLITPIFRRVAVVDGTSFTVNAANTYFRPDGTAYAIGTVVPQGTFIMVSLTSNIPAGLDTVTATGVPYRLSATVTQGGWSVPTANSFFDANGTAFSAGSMLAVGTVVFYKTSTTLPTGNISAGSSAGSDNGSTPLYVVGGYATSNAVVSIPAYRSFGLVANASYTPLGTSLTAVATRLSSDTPVDASVTANYYGNPSSGTSSTLHLSGQFYSVPANYWFDTQTAPTSINRLAEGKSTSGNGWDISWGTGSITTAGSALRLFSGPKHALAGPGYGRGDWADFSLYSNPIYSDFSKDKNVSDGAFSLNTGAGDLVVLGFRDVSVKNPGNLSSSGNVTIGAARDMVFSADANFNSSASKLVTLVAGGMLTSKKDDGSYATIGNSSGAGVSNLMVVAGGGVDLQTNVGNVVGSLQDNPDMAAPPMNGGMAPTGSFKINSVNPNGLVIGSTQTNNQVNDITFDGTAGVLYSPTAPLTRSGITTRATASQLATGSARSGYGAVELTTSAGDITVNGPIDSTSTGGNISVTAPVHVLQNANIAAGAGDVTLTASSGAITRTAGTVGGNDVVLTAATTIGSSTQAVHTSADTLRMSSAGDQYVTEANDVTLATSTSNNGSLVVQTTAGSITVGSASLANGISANGSGTVRLAAGGSGSDIIVNQALISGSGEINIKAAGSVALSANIGTEGNSFIEATAGSITRSAGTVSAADAVLTAGAGMGSGTSAVQTQVSRLGISAGADAWVENAGDLRVSGSSSAGLHVQSGGNLSVGSMSLQPGLTGNAAGYNGSGMQAGTALTLSAAGSISQTDNNQQLTAADATLSAGTTIGSSGQNMRTDVATLKMTSGGVQYLTEANDLVVASQSTNSAVKITTGGSLTVGTISGLSGISAGSGEVNLLASGNNSDLTVSANIQTTANAFLQAGRNIVQGNSNAAISADGLALTAAGQMASSSQPLLTDANRVGISTGNSAWVSDASSVTVSARSSGAGTLSVTTRSGTLTVENLSLSPTLAGNAAGYSLVGGAGVSAGGDLLLNAPNAGHAQGVVINDSLTAAGAIRVTASTTGQTAIVVADNLSAAGHLTLTGTTSDEASAIALSSGVQLTNSAGITRLEATQGNISVPGQLASRASIQQGTGAGAVQILAGSDASSNASIDASRLDINQGGNGGVLMQTTGNGNLTVARISNAGSGLVVLSAGSALAAGNGAGGQVVAATGNTVTQTGAGSTLVYSGNASDTSAMGTLVNGFSSDLRLADLSASLKQNARANSAYGATIVGSTEPTQLFLREKVNLDTTLQASATYADNLSGSGIQSLLSAANTGVITKAHAVGTFKINASSVVATLDTTALQNSSSFAGHFSTSGHLQARPLSSYALDTLTSDFSGVAGTLLVNKANAQVGATATDLMYNGQVQSQAPTTRSGFVLGDQIVVSGAASAKNAGTYRSSLQVSGNDVGNYNITITNADLTITPNTSTTVVLTANSDTRTYNGSAQSVSGYTVSGLVGEDAANAVAATTGISAGASGRNAASYASTFSGSNTTLEANYANIQKVNGTLVIDKAILNLNASSDTKAYDGSRTSGAVVQVSGLQGSDKVTGMSQSFDSRNAGTRTLSVNAGYAVDDGNSGGNYRVLTHTASGSITPNTSTTVVLTANSDTRTYNGSAQSVSGFTASGLLEATDTAGISAGTTGKNAGAYTTNFSGTSQLLANYANVRMQHGSLVIIPKEVSLSASKVYDATTRLTGPQLTIVTGVGNETLNYSSASLASKNVADNGTNHVASVHLTDGSGLASNYTFSPLRSALNQAEVTPAPLTIAARFTELPFNGRPQQQAPAAVDGLLGNDSVLINGLATGTAPGSYMSNLGATGSDASNYTVTPINAPLVILNPPVQLPRIRTEAVRSSEPMSRITLLGFGASNTGGATAALSKLGLSPSPEMSDACTAIALDKCACQPPGNDETLLLCQSQNP